MERRNRICVGLALGGGVVRGMGHVGALSILAQAGIEVDCVAGTSAGSIVGALYCAGIPLHRLKERAIKFGWLNLATPTWPARGLFSFTRLERWLVNELGDIEFKNLKIPLAIVATDLESGEQVVLREGRLAPAVCASCSIPGLVAPVEIGGRLLVDGSLVNTVPASVVRGMGADYVIAVDIFRSTLRSHWGPPGYGFAGLEILIRNAGGGLDDADCLISPELAGTSYFRFSKATGIIAEGERAAQACLPKLLADLSLG